MKKALSFAVALGLVAGMAGVASADSHLGISFNGTSRVRGRVVDGSQGTSELKYQSADMRTRLAMKAMVTDDVSVNARLTLISALFNTGANGTVAPNTDYAYIGVNNLLGGNWSFGRMPASWTKFFSWGGNADRVKAMYKAGNGTFGVFWQKTRETNNIVIGPAVGGQDKDAYSALYVGSAGDTKFKVIGIFEKDNAIANNNDGIKIDANVVAKAGDIGIEGEIAYTTGDLNEAVNGDAPMAIMVNVDIPVGDGMGVEVDAAYAENGFVADDDYQPMNLIGGASTSTAIDRFGNLQAAPAVITDPSDKAYLVAAHFNMKVDDSSSASFGLGYYMASDIGLAPPVAGELSFIEIDANYTRQLAKNTSMTFRALYAMPDTGIAVAPDDEIIGAGWELTTAW